MSVPTTMKAVINEHGKMVLKENVPVPKLDGRSMLIKTKAVGSNPFDGKLLDFEVAPEGCVMGSDVVGEIVQLGSTVDITQFKIGDVVSAIVNGGATEFPDNGAFAEYVKVDSNTVFKFPQKLTYSNKNNIEAGKFDTWEACASFPMVFDTALAAVFYELKLKLEWQPEKPQHDHPILIWGGATGIGQYAIQFVKQVHGFTKIITVASKKHEKMLKSFGADEVFDYHDKDVVDQITKKYDNIRTLIDCRSFPQTINQTYKCASKTGKAILVEFIPPLINCIEEENKRKNITVTTTDLYHLNDIPITFGPNIVEVDPNFRAKIIKCIKFFNPRLISGEIKHTPIKVYKGLEGAIEMVDDITQNKNSGVKFVSVL
ncbi:hypothetical protein MOUN0_O00804 [Monosporozyma unispora]|nr:hypothetical protein C6P44_001921 [Kazachstania unispora]